MHCNSFMRIVTDVMKQAAGSMVKNTLDEDRWVDLIIREKNSGMSE